MKRFILIFAAAVLVLGCTANKEAPYRTGDWDKVLQDYAQNSDSLQLKDIWKVNVALAYKGELADRAFEYLQYTSEGLIPEWNSSPEEGAALAHIYYIAGHIALAQKMAFETDVCEVGDAHRNDMLELLVKTNIIFGNYKVARKYISYLESQGGGWAKWAKAQRRFLFNDALVREDAEYGAKRACIPADNFQSGMRGIDRDFKDILQANPSHNSTTEVLGLYYLLDCNFDAFRQLLDEYYGSEALPVLPRSFAEAVCLMSYTDRGYWRRMGVSKELHKSFTDFLDRVEKGLSMDRYKDSYWLYVMRMNEE